MSEQGSGRKLLTEVAAVIEGKEYDDIVYVCCATLSFVMAKLPPEGRAQTRRVINKFIDETLARSDNT